MSRIQIRYFQTVLIVALIVGEIIASTSLTYAVLFGLVGIWFYESIVSQKDSDYINKSFTIFFGLLSYFFVIIFFQNSGDISNLIYFLSILFFLLLFISLTDISVGLMGSFLLYYIISLSIIVFIFSDFFYQNKSLLVWSLLLVFVLQNIALVFAVQYSNYQYYFKFSLVFVAVMGVLMFFSKPLVESSIASLGVAIFTTLLNDLIIRLRNQREIERDVETQIYIHDDLISLLGAFYLTNFISTFNGLF